MVSDKGEFITTERYVGVTQIDMSGAGFVPGDDVIGVADDCVITHDI
jgi:hypothetical protein